MDFQVEELSIVIVNRKTIGDSSKLQWKERVHLESSQQSHSRA